MNSSKTEWWKRASEILADPRFNSELRQIHGLANLSEYSSNPEEAKAIIPFSYQSEKLFAAAIQLFIAASLEVNNGANIQEKSLRKAFGIIGRLLYYLYLGEYEQFKDEDLLLRSALAFDLAGQSANGVVALRLRDLNEEEPSPSELPDVDLIAYLFFSRRISELRQLIGRWEKFASENRFNNPRANIHLKMLSALNKFLLSGGEDNYENVLTLARRATKFELEFGTTRDWYLTRGLELAVLRLRRTSAWLTLKQAVGELTPLWQAYIRGLALGTKGPKYSRFLDERIRDNSIIDFWPSQLSALNQRFLDPEVLDKVIKMPTSAGKTRLAEFEIISTLSSKPNTVCVYVVPFVALANEVREALRASLGRIGLRITDLFQGEFGLTEIDLELFKSNDVVICTPEKLDLVIRRNVEFINHVGLFIFDEGHMIDQTSRGIRYEFLIERLRKKRQRNSLKYHFLIMSAVVPNAEHLAEWISGADGNLIKTDWKPSDVRFGVFHWRSKTNERGDINYPREDNSNERYYVPGVIWRKKVKTQYYPHGKSQVCAELALALVHSGPVVIFASTKRNVESISNAVQKALKRAKVVFPVSNNEHHQKKLTQALKICEEFLGNDHSLIKALQQGFAYHTGDVPQSVRAHIEKLYEEGIIRVLVCTNTLGQGVNLPVKSLIIHSLFRGGSEQRISSRDFMNIAGRAARALRQLEGQVIFVHDNDIKSFYSYEKDVQNLNTIEGAVISSMLLLYASLAQKYDLLSIDEKDKNKLSTIHSKRKGTDGSERGLEDGIAAFDGQLLGLLVEQESESDAIDAAKILEGSLFDIQLKGLNINGESLYKDITLKMQSIDLDLADSGRRQRFYRTGLRRESCKNILEDTESLLMLLHNAPNTLDQAKNIIQQIFELSIKTDETKPSKDTFLIEDLFTPFWYWITGSSVQDIPRKNISLEMLTRLIEDLYVRKVPWGINSIMILSEEEIKGIAGGLPSYIQYLPMLARYGVPNPEAAVCRSIGVSDRSSSIKLAAAYLKKSVSKKVMDVIDWLADLPYEEFKIILLDDDTATRVFEEVQDAQLNNPGAGKFQKEVWERVEVRGLKYYTSEEQIKKLKIGDELLLNRDYNNQYDRNAIQILVPEAKELLGYMDRDIARLISSVMDEGVFLKALITDIRNSTSDYPVGRLFIQVYG